MQKTLCDLLHGLVRYSKYLEPGVLAGGVESLEDLVSSVAEPAKEVVRIVVMFSGDNSDRLRVNFGPFMTKHHMLIREIVFLSAQLVQGAPIWPGMYAWSTLHCALILLLEWHHSLNPSSGNQRWALWLANMSVVSKLEYDVRVRLAKGLFRCLTGKSPQEVRSELGLANIHSLVRLNRAVCAHVASRPGVDATLSKYTRAIVKLFGVVD